MVSPLHAPVTKARVVGEFRSRTIREAALRVVGRKGLGSATVEEIAREAGVAKGTVYLYFRSRDEIIEQATQILVEELLERVRAAIRAGGRFRDVLERVLTTHIGYFDEHRDFFRLYFATLDGSERWRQRRLANRRRHAALLVAMLEAAAARGEIADADHERTAAAIAGAAREAVSRRVHGSPGNTLADDVAFLAGLFCDGLARRSCRT